MDSALREDMWVDDAEDDDPVLRRADGSIVGAPATLNEYGEEDLSPTPIAGTGS